MSVFEVLGRIPACVPSRKFLRSVRSRRQFSQAMFVLLNLVGMAQGGRAQVSAEVDLSGFPDATNTGVPAGVTLTPSGGLVINTPGAVIQGLNITGSVIINAPNVTLRNCRVTSSDYQAVLIKPGITGAVVQNCDIDNQGAGGQGIAGQGNFIANNITNCTDGIDVRGDNTLIQDNYIHNMAQPTGAHPDGIQADGGFSDLSIIHNTVVNELGDNSSLMLDNYWGPIDNVLIDHNAFLGGGYTVYINEMASQPAGGGGSVKNVTFTNNIVRKGGWGHLSLKTELGHVPVMSGNIDKRTGAILAGQQTSAPKK
jgi:hypothetical protein